MRTVALVMLGACAHQTAESRPDPVEHVAPGGDEACLPDGKYGQDGSLRYSAMSPDEKSLSYCLVDGADETKRDCLRFDLETGAFHRLVGVKQGPDGPIFYEDSADVQVATATVDAADSKVVICKRGKSDCKSIPYDPPFAAENVSADVDDVGEVAAVIFDASSGSAILTLDVATGKPLATIHTISEPCVDAQMIGAMLFVNENVCDGPGAQAHLFDPRTGKLVGPVADGHNTYGAMPTPLGGDRWAVDDMGGKHVYIIDGKTGATEQTITLPPVGDTDNVTMDVGADDELLLVYDTGAVNLVDVKKGSAVTVRPKPCP